MQNTAEIEWIGDPLIYRRKVGFGLVIGRFHYLLDDKGKLESMQPATRAVLNMLLPVVFPNSEMAAAAYIRQVEETAQ